MAKKDWALALLVVLAWGLNFLVIRWGLDELPPLLLGALRFLLVAFPAILFIRPPKLPFRWLAAYGLTISFGQFAFLFTAMQVGMPAGLASLILQAQMFFSLLFAYLFLQERWQSRQWFALAVAGTGLSVLASQAHASTMTLAGFFLTLAAAASWGLGNIINRHIGQLGPVNLVSIVVWGALIPPLPFLAMSLWFEGWPLISERLANASLQSVGALCYLAFVATLFGYGSWAHLLRSYPAATVAPLTLLVPVIGLSSAWLILDETLNGAQMAGIALIIVGLYGNMFGLSHIKRLSR